jgi:hypothetical protein
LHWKVRNPEAYNFQTSFVLELDAFHEDIMWMSFVTSVIAAVSLQYVDPFGTSKLVLFQVSSSPLPSSDYLTSCQGDNIE